MKRAFIFPLCIIFATPMFCEEPDYTLTLYTIPSNRQMDFSTPHRLAWSALENAMHVNVKSRKHAMGHVFIELSGPDSTLFVGSTKENRLRSGRDEIIGGSGMGILFMGIDGRLEFDEEITADLNYHYRRGSITFIEAKISPENYERLHCYIKEYQARGYHTIYNGFNRPREGQGAGCTAFGLSFFDVAGILPRHWANQWSVSVEVPYRLIGRPISNKSIPLGKVFFSGAWAKEHEASLTFKISDPYLIYEWITDQWVQLTEDRGSVSKQPLLNTAVEALLRGNAKGIKVDFSHIPPPNEPIFTPVEVEINKATEIEKQAKY
jgi:hypothetical protein